MTLKEKVNKARASSGKNRQKLREEFYQIIDQGGMNPREAVRNFRIMIGKSQPEFAQFTGVSLKVLRDFEQGKGNPTLKTLEKLLTGSGLELKVDRMKLKN